MPDYTKGKIYTIRSYQTDKIYIGSTIQPLSVRFAEHRKNYKLHQTDKYHYVSSFDIIKFDDCYIELLKLCPCLTKEELHKQEGEQIRNNNICVNKVVPGRTVQQYKLDNIDNLRKSRKEYFLKNEEREVERRKKWREENKERIMERSQTYYDNNKEKIRQKQKERVICEQCNKEYVKICIKKHCVTKFHQASLNII